jgi:hypothetical protein
MNQNQMKSTGDATAFARDTAEHYKAAMALCDEDGRLRALKYLLLRLTVGNLLRREEVDDLRKLGQAVFGESDPAEAAKELLNRPSPSPLAIVIANTALAASNTSKQRSMLGAVLGAHASIAMAGGAVDMGLVTFAAMIGSAVAETTRMIQEFVGNQWEQFATRE